MRLSEHAKRCIREATHDVNVWDGPVGSSKTQTSTLAFIRYLATEAPPGPVAMVGNSQDSVHRNVVPALRSWLGVDHVGVKRNELRMVGRTVYVFGGATEAHQDAIAGMSLAGAYVDEASLVAESMWNMLGTRLRIGRPRLFATTNPASPRHWLYQRWVSQPAVHLTHESRITNDDGMCARFTMGPSDNLGMNPATWERMKRSYTGAFYKRYILGEWAVASGLVYPHYQMALSTDPAPTLTDETVGFDHGTDHPAAAMLIGQGVDGHVWAADEWVHDSAESGQVADFQYVTMLTAWLNKRQIVRPSRIYVDPAAAHFKAALRSVGMPATNADNSVADGINLVASMIASGLLKIDARRCPRLVDGLDRYQWDPAAQAKGEDKPLKEDDDEVDALRYPLASRRKMYQLMMARRPALRAVRAS